MLLSQMGKTALSGSHDNTVIMWGFKGFGGGEYPRCAQMHTMESTVVLFTLTPKRSSSPGHALYDTAHWRWYWCPPELLM